ncbi:MAG: UDP-N-acetylmuramoyl-tripeptide--D-alanyl-D-alanine ligase [Eggerthellaceae bacterium]|nr:UDP-N-acetylmuramoyl-tripeptide--D-alanyl-D-alanine ligase [Eggerthellaceae bacterium]
MLITVADLASAVGAPRIDGAAGDVVVTGLTWDSRDVAPGDLYVAFAGERVDGHDFAEAAVDAGAVAVLATRDVDAVVPVIIVSDVAAAITDLAKYWREQLTGTVVGLTGSSGKTTTKNLVRDVLAHDLTVVATKANQNNELGVPATLLTADHETDVVVVEMGMRGRGQIAELAEIAQPDWGLITNVGTSHMELLGSRDEIANAKAELYEALPESYDFAFVNADDDYADYLLERGRFEERGVTPVYYSTAEDPAERTPLVWASDVVFDGEGCPTFTMNAVGFEQLDLEESNGSMQCTLLLRGMHNVSNACAAAAVGLASGMTLASCCAALEAANPEKGRQVVHRTESGLTVIDDAYNANPDSMAASLSTFAAMSVAGRRLAVLGDMLELGDLSRESHERVGAQAAKAGLDALVCVGELSRSIASGAVAAGMPESAVTTCDDAASALELVASGLAPGDAVRVTASHSIGLERVVEGLVR